jgi:DNA-binding transcriptional MerR regulator
MEQREGFLNKEVAKITGMEKQTISYYTNQGLVIPSVDVGRGRGSNRRYSDKDIVKFLLIKELSNLNLNLKKIKIVFDQLSDSLFNPSAPQLRPDVSKRELVCIYNAHSENMKTMFVSMFDPTAMRKYYEENSVDGLGREIPISRLLNNMTNDLKSFKIDMLNNSSAIVVDITELYKVVEGK